MKYYYSVKDMGSENNPVKLYNMKTPSGHSILDYDVLQLKEFGLNIQAYDCLYENSDTDRLNEPRRTPLPSMRNYFTRSQSSCSLRDYEVQPFKEFGVNTYANRVPFDGGEGPGLTDLTSNSSAESHVTRTTRGNSILDLDILQLKEFGLFTKHNGFSLDERIKDEPVGSSFIPPSRASAKSSYERTMSVDSILDFDVLQFKEFGLDTKTYRVSNDVGGTIEPTDSQSLPKVPVAVTDYYTRTRSGNSIFDFDVLQFKEFGLDIKARSVSYNDVGGTIEPTDSQSPPNAPDAVRDYYTRTRSGNSILDFDVLQFKEFGLNIKTQQRVSFDEGPSRSPTGSHTPPMTPRGSRTIHRKSSISSLRAQFSIMKGGETIRENDILKINEQNNI